MTPTDAENDDNRPPADAGADADTVLVLEFTIEPFVAGEPGPHVLAGFERAGHAEERGAETEIGPFGTTVRGPASVVLETANEISAAAFGAGASQISMQIRVDPRP